MAGPPPGARPRARRVRARRPLPFSLRPQSGPRLSGALPGLARKFLWKKRGPGPGDPADALRRRDGDSGPDRTPQCRRRGTASCRRARRDLGGADLFDPPVPYPDSADGPPRHPRRGNGGAGPRAPSDRLRGERDDHDPPPQLRHHPDRRVSGARAVERSEELQLALYPGVFRRGAALILWRDPGPRGDLVRPDRASDLLLYPEKDPGRLRDPADRRQPG